MDGIKALFKNMNKEQVCLQKGCFELENDHEFALRNHVYSFNFIMTNLSSKNLTQSYVLNVMWYKLNWRLRFMRKNLLKYGWIVL